MSRCWHLFHDSHTLVSSVKMLWVWEMKRYSNSFAFNADADEKPQ